MNTDDRFIIATIGQPTDNEKSLTHILRNSRVKYLRYNLGAKLGYDVHRARTLAARELIEKLGLVGEVGIMYDLPFPASKVRIGMLPEAQHPVKAGDIVRFRSGSTSEDFHQFVPVEFPNIGKAVELGQIISIGDGELALRVAALDSHDQFSAVCLSDGAVPCVKSLNFGTFHDNLESEENIALLSFVSEMSPDSIVLSFIENVAQLISAKAHLRKQSVLHDELILAVKLETPRGVSNAEALSKHTDLMILGRGDLGVTSDLSEFGFLQNDFLKLTARVPTPLVVATQIIESSSFLHVPMRAELADLTNMLICGARGLLLAKETSANSDPRKTLELIDRIMTRVESRAENPLG